MLRADHGLVVLVGHDGCDVLVERREVVVEQRDGLVLVNDPLLLESEHTVIRNDRVALRFEYDVVGRLDELV